MVTGAQLEAAYTTSTVAAGTLLSFTGAGSILFEDSTINPTLFTASLVGYTPAPITIANTTPAPLILTATGGNNGGSTYGNVLDNYFNHVDIENTGSTYSYMSTFSDLTVPSGLFDQYGTAQATPTSAPTLYDITVTPNDIHFLSNVVNLPLIVGTFDPPGGGYASTDTAGSGGTFTGSATQPSLLQGQYSSETMIGNESTFSVAPTTSLTNQTSLVYGTNELGNNMLINTNSGTIAYGDAQTINFNITPTNTFDSNTNTVTITTPNVTGSSFDLGSNAFDVTGTAYGAAQTFNMTVQNYDDIVDLTSQGLTFVGVNNVNFDNNTINIGSQTIFGQGILYGDIGAVNFTVHAGTGSATNFGETLDVSASVSGNTFDFGANQIIDVGSNTSSLYAGIGSLTVDLENGTPNNPVNQGTVIDTATFSNNTFTFGNTTEQGGSGVTNFYGDINDLSFTNFDLALAVAQTNGGTVSTITVGSNTYQVNAGGYVQIEDSTNTSANTHGNIINFENDTMTAGTGTSAFNVGLFATNTGNAVAEGNTTINNFGAPGSSNHNLLNIELSQALYNDISTANGHATAITGAMLDNYFDTHNGTVINVSGNTTFEFSDGVTTPNGIIANDLGSITLTGVTASSFHSLGTNLEITGNGITTVDPLPNPATIFNTTIPGDTLSSYTQNTQIMDVSSLGHVVDFAGQVDLNMSNALFKTLGLSDSNTAAQNLRILENDVNTPAGGIAVTAQTTGTGANAVTNTILTFESMVGGHINTYGSVTLNNTHFNPADPLQAHLVVTHH